MAGAQGPAEPPVVSILVVSAAAHYFDAEIPTSAGL